MRLDLYLSENGLCKSRSVAQAVIDAGGVTVNGKTAVKSSLNVTENDDVKVAEESKLRYVGRGGLKLEKAIEYFRIDLNGAVCVDIGSSTGGFTDCMLQNGAERVFAVDVGRDQLDSRLKNDSRVISLEQTDIRDFNFSNYEYDVTQADFIGTDVSFISLKLIIPHIYRLLKNGGTAVALIKPQFEVGKSNLNKNGIVKNDKIREKCVAEITAFAQQCGFTVIDVTCSPITGGSGNIEYLLGLCKKEAHR